MTAPTLSRLQLVAACPGSASLSRFAREGGRAPTLGRAIHEVVQGIMEGRDAIDTAHLWADILDVADEGRLAFLATHLALPVPGGALAEVPLGYWPDGSVRRVQGGAGRYLDEGQILSGTIDVMWAEPLQIVDHENFWPMVVDDSTLWIVDWKTGAEEHVPPVDRNWQIQGGAVLAARWTGAQRVIPAICYVNAAECAEAVRDGRAYEGRWEVGAPLDAAALDATEVEMRAVLARARGEEDATLREQERRARDARRRSGSESEGGPLILGPHCDHCDARGACPALAAEALTLLRADGRGGRDVSARRYGSGFLGGGEGGGVSAPGGSVVDDGASGSDPRAEPGGADDRPRPLHPGDHGSIIDVEAALALTPAQRSHLAGILPALRRTLDSIEVAIKAGGPVALADGRTWAPAIETMRSYRTRETFDALEPVVGEDAANDAAQYTAASIKRALDGLPRAHRAAVWKDLEARGAVVVTAREVWRRTWPAKPVEGGEDGDARTRGPATWVGSASITRPTSTRITVEVLP